jgi:hypothetical protein
MSSASIERTLELWASSLRDVKARMRPLFGDVRVASSANQFLDGLTGRSHTNDINRQMIEYRFDQIAKRRMKPGPR